MIAVYEIIRSDGSSGFTNLSAVEGLDELLKKLSKPKTSVTCLYINKLADVDMKVLEELVRKSYEHSKKTLT